MDRIVECVPNFSDGRNPKTVTRLVGVIESVATARVLDTHLDPDHNRSVITFVSEPEYVVEAGILAVECAIDLIDMRKHTGEHPRLGATDVLPFVPVRGVTMDDCILLAHQAGERIAQEFSIPVYFYERAARRSERRHLEDVRRGGLELLRSEISQNPSRAPDLGPLKVHETAGALAIGARPFLIAFNINLKTGLATGKRIAKAVRARSGGLPFVKALGFELQSRGLVQVSMNLVSYDVTGMAAAYDAVSRAAREEGAEIVGTEIVGLVPENALDRKAEYFAKLENFSEDIVFEKRLEKILNQ